MLILVVQLLLAFFVLAYKRKLEERRQLAAADKKQEEEDERQDVTKKTGGAAFASFYGNFNKNIAMGGESDKPKDSKEEGKEGNSSDSNKKMVPTEPGFLSGFERSGNNDHNNDKGSSPDITKIEKEADVAVVDPEVKRMAARKAREKKIAEARIRYFQRNGLSPEGAPMSQ